jgi:beta-lactam-binding protein with PASTA domain
VNLLVAAASDEAPDGFVMPDLVGLPIVTAQAMLAKVGIKTGTPVVVPAAIAPVSAGDAAATLPLRAGSVVSQTPAAGSRVDQSVLVKLSIAQ